MISKNVSITKQNSAVPAASGRPYFDKTLLSDKLKACAKQFHIHYGVLGQFNVFVCEFWQNL